MNSSPAETGVIVATHDGAYHADELFAVSTLQGVMPVNDIIRSRKTAELSQANFLIDVGGKYLPDAGFFDHHGEAATAAPRHQKENTPMASFGLVFQTFGSDYLKNLTFEIYRQLGELSMEDLDDWQDLEEVVRKNSVTGAALEMVRQSLVVPIDAWDNGSYPDRTMYTISSAVAAMSDASYPFEKALDFASVTLRCTAIRSLAKALRSERLRTLRGLEDHGPVVKIPVKPYSLKWVRKWLNRPDITVAYFESRTRGFVDVVTEKGKDNMRSNDFKRRYLHSTAA